MLYILFEFQCKRVDIKNEIPYFGKSDRVTQTIHISYKTITCQKSILKSNHAQF
jgi:hypothetical protein